MRMPWRTREDPTPTSRAVEGFTAASQLIDLEDPAIARRETARQRKRPLKWQRDAWYHFDEVPEVRAFGRWMGDAQSRVRLFPVVLPEDPDQQPVPATQAEGVSPHDVDVAIAALDRLSSEEGDRSEMQRVAGVNLAIAGEAWIVGTDDNPEWATPFNPTGEQWKVYSVEELTVRDDRWAIQPYPGARDDELEYLDPVTTSLIRCYRRHGRWHEWPDSPMRSANIIAEEILLATQHILGSLRSRLPAGLLPIPDDLEMDEDEDSVTEDAADPVDPLLRMMAKHLSTPLTDPRSAAALVPFLLRVPPDMIDKIKLVDVAKAIDPNAIDRLEQLVKRLAIAVDMPPEALTGMAGLNHWSAWLVGEDAVRTHIEPYTELYCSALTMRYFRPRLDAAGVAEPYRWAIGYDASDCIAHPDKKQNAQDGWDRLVINDHTYVASLGYSDENMPDEEEVARRVAQAEALYKGSGVGPADANNVKTGPPVDSQPVVSASSSSLYEIGAHFGLSPIEVERMGPEELVALIRSDDAEQTFLLAAAGVQRGEPIGVRWARIEAGLARDLLVDCDAALRRVLERAQNRIRSAATRAPLGADKRLGQAIRAQARALAPAALAVALGPDQVHALGLGADDLFDGSLGSLEEHFYAWTDQARVRALAELARLGIDTPGPDVDSWDEQSRSRMADAWAVLSAGLTASAAGLLFAAPGPETAAPLQGEWDATLSASPAIVRDALTAAGGGPSTLAESQGVTTGGLLGGEDFISFLEVLPDFDLTGWVWTVGAPDRPFEPHQALDGVEFTSWEDEALTNDEAWPDYSSFFPGDHVGCQCQAVANGEQRVTVDEPPEGEG